MSTADEMARSLIAQRAVEWFIVHRGEAAPRAEERAAFVAWLKASPEHVREYLAVAGFSRELGSAVCELDVPLEDLLQQASRETGAEIVAMANADISLSGKHRRNGYWLAAAVVAAVCVALTTFTFLKSEGRAGLAKTYSTAHAEQGTWRLSDGTVMQLNSDSRVLARFSSTERHLEVVKGQAHFQVSRDPQRRFRVTADEASIVALGTEFDVYRRGDATLVTVMEGKVAVTTRGQRGAPRTTVASAPQDADAARIELTAGQQASVDADSARLKRTQANLRASVAWLQREIAFEQQPLGEVAREFNRYSRAPIEIESAEIGSLKISGVFNAYDTESFIAFLRRLDDVAVQATPGSIRVTRRSSTAHDSAAVSR